MCTWIIIINEFFELFTHVHVSYKTNTNSFIPKVFISSQHVITVSLITFYPSHCVRGLPSMGFYGNRMSLQPLIVS